MRHRSSIWMRLRSAASAAMAVLLVSACVSADKAPAEAAIKAAEQAVTAARTSDAAKYAPDQVTSLDAAMASAKAAFDKGDYASALSQAKDVAVKARELPAMASAKKAEMAKAWADMSGGVPQMVGAIRSRVDILSQSKKLPAGLDQSTVQAAKTGLSSVNQTWTEASEAYKAGNLSDAIGKATDAKKQAAEIMTALNMQVPTAAR
jgi:hypothetical protein